MSLRNIEYKKSKKPLKISKVGMEIETHVLDSKGYISNKGPDIIKAVNNINNQIPIIKECGKNMIELGCYPGKEIVTPALDLIYSMETTFEVAEKKNLNLFPFATYPGKFAPKPNAGLGYKLKKKIFSKNFDLAMKCTGFHNHYSLPKGVFDAATLDLKELKRSKLSRSMISAYNFEIAIDPILTLFTQSSPFFEGSQLAKDSRMLVYRGGKKLKYPGLYAKYQQIGGLPPYKQTGTDLIHSLELRAKKWRKLMKRYDPQADFDELYESKLKIGWNPVKINVHGTIEQRGMDMNFLSILFGVSVLIKSTIRKIQEEFIEVLPADFAIHEPFKFEKGILYIPPHSHVRNRLQKSSAYEGYSNDELCQYAKRFFKLAKSMTSREELPLLGPVNEMLEDKESVSDKIVKYAKNKGYVNDHKIGNKDAANLALHYSEEFQEDFAKVKQRIVHIKGL